LGKAPGGTRRPGRVLLITGGHNRNIVSTWCASQHSADSYAATLSFDGANETLQTMQPRQCRAVLQ